jgi:hypothetical protein
MSRNQWCQYVCTYMPALVRRGCQRSSCFHPRPSIPVLFFALPPTDFYAPGSCRSCSPPGNLGSWTKTTRGRGKSRSPSALQTSKASSQMTEAILSRQLSTFAPFLLRAVAPTPLTELPRRKKWAPHHCRSFGTRSPRLNSQLSDTPHE